jgi:hypothetical protein
MLKEYHTGYALPITTMKLYNWQISQAEGVVSTMLRSNLVLVKRNSWEDGENFTN